MRFKANYNFTVNGSTFVKGDTYEVTDADLVDQLNGLEKNPYGDEMISLETEKKATKAAKETDKGETEKEEDEAEVLELQKKFKTKFGKDAPVTYKNNRPWLEKKLAE